MDEGVVGPDGRTLWEVQEGVDLGGASGGGDDDDGPGSKCGSFGLDLMAPLALLWLARRRRKARR